MTTCPKCKKTSGDDWSQCEGRCPMPASPRYEKKGETCEHGKSVDREYCVLCGWTPKPRSMSANQ